MKKNLSKNLQEKLEKEIYKNGKINLELANEHSIFCPQTDDEDFEYFFYLENTLIELDLKYDMTEINYYIISLDVLKKAVEKFKTKIGIFKNEGNNDIIIIPMIDELSHIEKFMEEKFDVKPDWEFYTKFRMDYLKSFLKVTKIMNQLGLQGKFTTNEYIMNKPGKEKLLEIKLNLPTEQLKDILKD